VNQKIGFSLCAIAIVALAAAACSSSLLPAALAPPTPIPATFTPSQTLTAAPTATPTPPPPSATPTITQTLFPTITPIPTDTPIPSFTPVGAGPTATPEFACQVVEKSPDNWQVFKPRASFDGIWKVKNTGSLTWKPQRIVLKFLNGARLYADEQEYDLRSDVEPDSLALLIADLVAPKGKGEYASTWGLVDLRLNVVICSFTVKITVE
jgi:hypothetical protein